MVSHAPSTVTIQLNHEGTRMDTNEETKTESD